MLYDKVIFVCRDNICQSPAAVTILNSIKKDEYRISLTLNYMRRKLRDMGKIDESNDILRFQLLSPPLCHPF